MINILQSSSYVKYGDTVVLYNPVKHSVYISIWTSYPNQFRNEEIQSPSTCIHGNFMELDSAVYLHISHIVLQ